MPTEPIIFAYLLADTWTTVVLTMLCVGLTLMSALCAYVGIRYLQLRAFMYRTAFVLPTYQQLGVLVQDYLDAHDETSIVSAQYEKVLLDSMRGVLESLKKIN